MQTDLLTVEALRSILDEKLAPLKTEIAELRQFIDCASKKYDEVMTKLKEQETLNKAITKENQFLKSTVNALDSHVKKLQILCNDMEQYSRRECVEIQGIPVSEHEDTNKIVVQVGELMGVEIKEDDISIPHRLPTSSKYKGKKSVPPIIAKFVRRNVKERYFKGRKQLKDRTTCDLGISPERRIFINESLTERNKGLFNESVKTKKDLNISYIWTSNGKIYLRKSQDSSVIPINNKDDLKKLYPS